ncbi:hypothetical protein MRB53_039383 [Persea americana]|nr:hypothetical protein MRB53_039383 [Persea americana]
MTALPTAPPTRLPSASVPPAHPQSLASAQQPSHILCLLASPAGNIRYPPRTARAPHASASRARCFSGNECVSDRCHTCWAKSRTDREGVDVALNPRSTSIDQTSTIAKPSPHPSANADGHEHLPRGRCDKHATAFTQRRRSGNLHSHRLRRPSIHTDEHNHKHKLKSARLPKLPHNGTGTSARDLRDRGTVHKSAHKAGATSGAGFAGCGEEYWSAGG